MLGNHGLSTVKLKKYIKTRNLLATLTFWYITLKDIKIFKKFLDSFIQLELHFDLCENDSYSTFVAKAGYFYAQKPI